MISFRIVVDSWKQPLSPKHVDYYSVYEVTLKSRLTDSDKSSFSLTTRLRGDYSDNGIYRIIPKSV